MKKTFFSLLLGACIIAASGFFFKPSFAQLDRPFGSIETPQQSREAGADTEGVKILELGGSESVVQFPHGNIFTGLMPFVIETLTILIGGIAVVVFVYAGANYLIKGDNPEEVGKSFKMLIYSAIGIAIAALSYSLVSNLLAAFA